MGAIQVERFSDAGALVEAAAGQFLDKVKQAGAENRIFSVALSGGRIAQKLFSRLADEAKRSGISLRNVHFFWADERSVPPTDPESNYLTADKYLFQPLSINSSQVHRIAGEKDGAIAAQEAEEDMRRTLHASEEGVPVLDLVLLGMGEDGHVASLFPNEAESVQRSTAIYRPVMAAKPPPARVTIGYDPLRVAKHVWAIVSGPGKEKMLAGSLNGSIASPLARVTNIRNQTQILTDLPQ